MGKPFKIVTNSDPGDIDHVGGDDWDSLSTFLNNQSDYHTYSYYVYNDSGTYKAKNGKTGVVDYSSSDVSIVLDSIVNNISPAGTPTMIQLGAGDFNMNTVFNNITSASVGNITIKGMGIGVTNLIATSSIASGNVFDVEGAVTGSQTTLTGNAAAGAVTIDVTDASTFAAGDTILLRSTAAFSSAGSAQGKKGEIHKIASKASNTITLGHWTHDSYNTADTANIIKLAMLKNITIEDLSLKKGNSYNGNGNFFFFNYCDNLRINRVHIEDFYANVTLKTAMELASCINWRVDVILEQTANATFNSQYGFKPTCASENGKAQITGTGKWRHLVTIDATGTSNREGQVRNIEFSGTGDISDEAVWDTHATGENIKFINCNVQASISNGAGTSDDKGFQMRAKKCTIQNCTVSETVGTGILMMEDSSGSIISGCNIYNTRELPNGTSGNGIGISNGVNNLTIVGNNINSSKRKGISIASSSSGHTITGNTIINNGGNGIDAVDITETVVSGNRITGNDKGLNMTGTCNYWGIVGNLIKGNTNGNTIIGANTVNQNNVT